MCIVQGTAELTLEEVTTDHPDPEMIEEDTKGKVLGTTAGSATEALLYPEGP